MTKRNLYHGIVPDTTTEVYASGGQAYTSIFSATVANASAADSALEVWAVADGETPTDANKLLTPITVLAGQTIGLQTLINFTLSKGSSLHMKASTASSLCVQLSGDLHS